MTRRKRGTYRERVWAPLAREIISAHARVQWARSIATRTNESDVRLHYLEMWLASLKTIARSIP